MNWKLFDMKKTFLLALLPLFITAQPTPRIIVGIVVDQMRFEMLTRYSSIWGEDGFKRLMRDGIVYDSCLYTYVPTSTGPGHATIYTGKNPNEHGIVSNNWFIPAQKKSTYCVEDNSHEPVGTDDEKFARSPKNLMQPTLGEYLKKHFGSQSITYAISLKDRAAILPHGMNGEGAFWMDHHGQFATSSYFMAQLPGWLEQFNNSGYMDEVMQQVWQPGIETDDGSPSSINLPDNSPFEKDFNGNGAVFPYKMQELIEKNGASFISYTPWGNEVLTNLAIHILQNTTIGHDEVPDLLAISYSATDIAGHAFGPMSAEMTDIYYRLDQDMARLLRFLEENYGRDGFMVFLTSDHGAANTPADSKFSYAKLSVFKAYLDAFSQKKFKAKVIAHVDGYQIFLNKEVLAGAKITEPKAQKAMTKAIKKYKAVKISSVYTRNQMLAAQTTDAKLMQQSFVEELTGDIFFTTPEGVMWHEKDYGITHGSRYLYDTHVPFILYSPELKSESSVKSRVAVSDIMHIVLAMVKGEPYDR